MSNVSYYTKEGLKKLFNDLKSLSFDLIIIGTPPKTHYKLLIKIIEKLSFKKLMVEKPFSVYKEKNNYYRDKRSHCRKASIQAVE